MNVIQRILFKIKVSITLLGLLGGSILALLMLASYVDSDTPSPKTTIHNTLDWILDSTAIRLEVRRRNILRNKVIGVYELETGGRTYKGIFLDTGIVKNYTDGMKGDEEEWEIEDGEVHICRRGYIMIFSINPDGSLTKTAMEDKNGKRKNYSKNKQDTFTKKK